MIALAMPQSLYQRRRRAHLRRALTLTQQRREWLERTKAEKVARFAAELAERLVEMRRREAVLAAQIGALA